MKLRDLITMGEAKNLVKAVQTGLKIIEALQENRCMGVTELADQLNVTKGTISGGERSAHRSAGIYETHRTYDL